jgi:hypothetical protein
LDQQGRRAPENGMHLILECSTDLPGRGVWIMTPLPTSLGAVALQKKTMSPAWKVGYGDG